MSHELEYEAIGVQNALSRFGLLRTPAGSYEMPAMSPGIRTDVDAEAVLKTMRGGVPVMVITPYLSWSGSHGSVLRAGLRSARGGAALEPLLILPDPESEAFSFSCVARNRYRKTSAVPVAIRELMRCGLTHDRERGERLEVYQGWNHVEAAYGFAGLEKWLETRYVDAGSRVFFAIGPILRSNPSNVVRCFELTRTILLDEVSAAVFHMYGVHLILHVELFNGSEEAKAALGMIYEQLEILLTSQAVPDLFVSFKIHDASGDLQDPQVGSARRRALSEFVSDVAERVRRARGAFIAHNFANLGLGMLDSGADVAAFRVSGPMRIDMPIQVPRKGPRRSPTLLNPGTLSEDTVDALAARWRAKKAFPVPHGVEPQPYWNSSSYQDQVLYASHTRCAGLVELGREYRAAGVDGSIPLSEALRSRIMQSEIRQQLVDLCPSLGGI